MLILKDKVQEMIEVKINLVPFGQRNYERQIGFIKLWNDGTGNPETGNYKYEITNDRGLDIKGELKDFPRKEGAFTLIKEILNSQF